MAGPSGTTPNLQLPYPLPGDTVDVPRDVQALATKIDQYLALPVGAMLMWPTTSPPAGFLICNGSLVPAATYPQLAAILGSSGGNITLPDFRDRFPSGAGPTMSLLTAGGEATHLLTGPESGVQAHSHPATNTTSGGTHDHEIQTSGNLVVLQSGMGYDGHFSKGSGSGVGRTQDSASHVHSVTVANAVAKNGTPHNNIPPYRAINFVIRAA